ncbi:MAG: hypothetical protein QM790_03465 [Nibricoccus sp.]
MTKVRTKYRCKIGSHLNYPLRLSSIERALDSALDRFDIDVSFFDYKAPRPNESRPKHEVFEVFYRPDEPQKFEISVRPIPREVNSLIYSRMDSLLRETVVAWMSEEQQRGWSERSHSLFVAFDLGKDAFDIYRYDRP